MTEPPGGPRALDGDALALVAEGCTRSGVVWLRPDGGPRHHLAWHVWHENAVHVIAGGGEQELPPLVGAVEIVVPSKDTRGRLATVLAEGRVLAPGTSEWLAAVQALSAARLNDRDLPGQRDRWARGARVTRLEPVRLLQAGPGDDATPAGLVRPPAEGSTTGARPWHLGGRAGRRSRRRRGERSG